MKPPPLPPFRPGFWRSPLRGPWLTTVLGTLLLGGVIVVALTGFLSHAAYEPGLGRNGIVDPGRDLPLGIGWPASPAWLYGLTQSLHVNVGLVTVPLLLAKLWSVIPRLFAWPPVSSPAQAIERGSIALLVASAVFEFATGIINAQNYYPFAFSFVPAHYYGAVVFVASLAVHIVVKLPVMARAYRERGVLRPLREDLAHTRPEPADPDGLVARDPAPPTITRRGLLGVVGAGSALLLLANVGESIGGPLRRLSLLAPRGGDPGSGPNGFQVNKTARVAGVTPAMTGDGYRLLLRSGERELRLSRADLLALEQRTETLPIACVEGWTTTQRWTGVALASIAAMVGAERGERAGRGVAAARRGLPAGVAHAHPVRQRARAAGAEGQRRRPLDRPRVPGPHHRARAARRAQHEVGRRDDVQGHCMSRFRRRYGASPLHALAHLAAFALAGFALLQLVDVRAAWNVFAWLLAAVVLHDFVLLPFYSALDRVAQAASGDAVNYLRVPVALSALLLLVFFPLILGCSTGKLEQVSGAPAADYLARWLLITGALCAGSAVLYGRRVRRAAAKRPPGAAAATARASENVSTSRKGER